MIFKKSQEEGNRDIIVVQGTSKTFGMSAYFLKISIFFLKYGTTKNFGFLTINTTTNNALVHPYFTKNEMNT